MSRRKWQLSAGILLGIAAVVCFILLFRSCTETMPQAEEIVTTAATTVTTTTTAATTVTTAKTTLATTQTTAEPEPAYVSPIDFEALKAQNEDVYAWLEVVGSEIQYPVAQSASDDTYYLTHDIDGNYDTKGMIFSEHQYNGTYFSDPVTILYGHRRKDLTMFSRLQPLYSDKDYFEEHREIIVYLPDKELHYRIVAAVPYDNRHILYKYDFTNAKDFVTFFDGVFGTRTVEANVDTEAYPDYDDRILILSTCLWGDKTQRYLVISVLQNE